jgi:hypothetical protein
MSRRISLSLFILIVLALLFWGGLLLFTRYVAPTTSLAFVAFFIILTVALTCSFAPIAYAVGQRLLSVRYYHASVRAAIRQGLLLALVVVLNLIFRALDSWNIFMACVILAAAVVVEVLSLAGK